MISDTQLRMARAALHWTILDLASRAEVSPATIVRLEANLPARQSTVTAICKSLTQAGIVFMRNGDGDGIHLTHAGQCVHDLIELANSAPEKAEITTAVRERIDRYLATSISWQIEDVVCMRQLRDCARAASLDANPGVSEALKLALIHLKDRNSSPSRPR
jgi:DNA-binding XRE family transcriptional regulator